MKKLDIMITAFFLYLSINEDTLHALIKHEETQLHKADYRWNFWLGQL